MEASKRSAAQSLINHTPSSNTASIRLPGAAVGVPPAGVALEERGAKGSSVVRVQVSKLLRKAGREGNGSGGGSCVGGGGDNVGEVMVVEV